MSLKDLTDPNAVLAAIAEFDALGRERFLEKYGFGEARSYFLIHNGRSYDSKAIVGVAHGLQYPEKGPLRASEFSGGFVTVRTQLKALGFTVQYESEPVPSPSPRAAPPPADVVRQVPVRRPAWRTPRPFDPSRRPVDFTPGIERALPEETLALREKAVKEHHELLAALHQTLQAASWTDIQEIPAAIDLWARSPGEGRRVIFEAKTLGDEVHQARTALAQLLEYRLVHGAPEDELCLVVDGQLSDERERILTSLDIAVLWYDGRSFLATDEFSRDWLTTLVTG